MRPHSEWWLAAALLLATGCTGKSAPSAPAPAAPAAVAAVTEEVLPDRRARILAFPATVEAAETLDVVARSAGVVAEVAVREGDQVAAGDLLVLLDDRRARASASAAQAALARALARHGLERAQLARRERAGDAVSAEELAAARAAVAVAAAETAMAEAELAARLLDLAEQRIVAPAAGVVDSRPVRPGQQLAAGTRVVGMVQRRPLFVRASVVESEAQRLAPGQAVAATAASLAAGVAATAAGRVIHVGQRADPQTRMIEVLARLDQDPGWLPGSFATLGVVLGTNPNPWLPIWVVRTSERGPVVWTASASGAELIAVERAVRTGAQDVRGQIEILAGLPPGTRVVLASLAEIRPGMRLRAVSGAEYDALRAARRSATAARRGP